jgi:hypothetical protein
MQRTNSIVAHWVNVQGVLSMMGVSPVRAPHAPHVSALASSPVSFAGSSPRRLGLMASAVSTAAICLSGLTVLPARASTVTFVTPTGSTVNDGAVNASASFITGPGSISVTLTDLLADPKSVGQLLSDISFTFTGGLASNASLTSGTGQEIAVGSDGTFRMGASVAAGWGLQRGRPAPHVAKPPRRREA